MSRGRSGTVRRNGQPVSAATWYLLRHDDRVLVNMDVARKRLADIDALSRHYLGRQYPDRKRPRISALIEVDRVHGWGAQKNNDQPDGRG